MKQKLSKTRYLLSILLVALLPAANYTAWAELACEKFLVATDASIAKRQLAAINELNIGTYNVENLFMHLGHHDPVPGQRGQMRQATPQKDKPVEKIAGVAKAILDMNLDILVLQEVENIEALRVLNTSYLKDQYIPVLIEGNDPRGIDVGFLVKKDLPFAIENDSFRKEAWVDPRFSRNTKSPIFSRDLPTLVFRSKEAAQDSAPLFILIGTHYKSKRPTTDANHRVIDEESNVERGAQVDRTVDIIERYRKEYGADVPILLAGDFNGAMNYEPEFKPLKQKAHLTDAFDANGQHLTDYDRVTHIYFPKRANPDPKQMDAIFVSPELQADVAKAEVYRYTDSTGKLWPRPWNKHIRDKNPSDHYPVKITLKLNVIKARAASSAAAAKPLGVSGS